MSEETTNTNEVAEENGVTEESIRVALRGVMDPELHLDVVTLGLIRSVDLDSTPVVVKMLLTTPFCPYGPWMVGQVKETAELAAGQEVKVEVLPEQWHPEMMEDPTLLGFF
jgi:metal-sulfur cluster biosynthetic enzyme